MRSKVLKFGSVIAAAGVLAFGAQAAEPIVPADIMALHQKMLVLDTHLDSATQSLGRWGWDVTKRHSYAEDHTQIDLPRMNEGGLDGGFYVTYLANDAFTTEGYARGLNKALQLQTYIRKLAANHPESFELAYKADDAARITAAGKKAVFQSFENSYQLGEDLSLLQLFYKLGVRMAGPVHSKTNQLADSSTDTAKWKGMSPLGKQWIAEMNRLGLIIDVSHSSDQAFDQMLALSKAPIIASHSGSKTTYDHPRNLDDARIKKLAAAGGVIQVNSIFIKPFARAADGAKGGMPTSALATLGEANDLLPADQAKVLAEQRADFEKNGLLETSNFDDYMKALLHIIKVAGPDHVGIGIDWDGGGGVKGMEDITGLPKITAGLKKAGYSDADIQKIWSGNVLRVMRDVEKAAAR